MKLFYLLPRKWWQKSLCRCQTLNVLDESSYNFTGLSAEEIKKLLTKSIQLNMRQLRATDVLAPKHVMLIARSLMKLLETFDHRHKGRFLDYVNNRLGISKSSYYYYMEYYAFMSKYPKFQNLAVSFRVFGSMIPKLTHGSFQKSVGRWTILISIQNTTGWMLVM